MPPVAAVEGKLFMTRSSSRYSQPPPPPPLLLTPRVVSKNWKYCRSATSISMVSAVVLFLAVHLVQDAIITKTGRFSLTPKQSNHRPNGGHRNGTARPLHLFFVNRMTNCWFSSVSSAVDSLLVFHFVLDLGRHAKER